MSSALPAASAAAGDRRSSPISSPVCGPQNAIPTVAFADIEKAVSPNAEQRASLVKLSEAADKADQAILATCPPKRR